MDYSCGYFRKPTDSLEEAQQAKLDHICRTLRVERGDRFLDIGCGWGGLLFHAAERYGATCTGCTLSHSQIEFVQEKLENRGSRDRIRVFETDFQNVRGRSLTRSPRWVCSSMWDGGGCGATSPTLPARWRRTGSF